jgi:hypothetical protein
MYEVFVKSAGEIRVSCSRFVSTLVSYRTMPSTRKPTGVTTLAHHIQEIRTMTRTDPSLQRISDGTGV